MISWVVPLFKSEKHSLYKKTIVSKQGKNQFFD
ncbi:hypothetical protein D6219_11515 [Coxiella burnetii]|nr:hypothetical protein [Coxiella burnetii]AZV76426.1 hypothetical protein D6219_11515 [Coxiella burnetii]RQM81392.1 hypothetical protein EHS20_01940 [Coxiella burnetii]